MPGVLLFRSACHDDVAVVTRMLRRAAERMMAEGKNQWTETYPAAGNVEADVADGVGYVLERDGTVEAYGAVMINGEPAYEQLAGRWLSDGGDYVVVHRMVVSQSVERTGVGTEMLRAIERFGRTRGARSIKIDTNYDNERMLGLLSRNGFTFCGEVHYPQGPRRAYEKLIDTP